MEIASNFLKAFLKNTYFFCGTACGGKTTISELFAKKHGFLWLKEETLSKQLPALKNPAYQPVTCSAPNGWDEYFNRPYRDYYKWLRECMNEHIPLALLEIIQASGSKTVVADICKMPNPMTMMELTEPNRIVFLMTSPEIVARDFYSRPSHKPIYDCIMKTRNPEKSLANDKKMLEHKTRMYLNEVKESGLFYIMRDDNSTVENTLRLVETHFCI